MLRITNVKKAKLTRMQWRTGDEKHAVTCGVCVCVQDVGCGLSDLTLTFEVVLVDLMLINV